MAKSKHRIANHSGNSSPAWTSFDLTSKLVRIGRPYIVATRACYYVLLYKTDPATGNESRRKVSTRVRRDSKDSYNKACAAALQILAEAQSNFDPSAPMRLQAFSESYIAECEAKGLSQSYLQQIRSAFQALMNHIGNGCLITQVSSQQVRMFFFGQKSGSMALSFYRALRAGFEVARRDGKIVSNPFDQVDLKSLRKKFTPRPRGILSPEQVVEIYTALPKESYMDRLIASFMLFLFGSACRRSEGCFLLKTAIDWERKSIRIAPTVKNKLKTASSAGEIPITKYAAIALREQHLNRQSHPNAKVRESQWVFCNEQGEPYQPASLTKVAHKRLMEVCKQLGINSEGVDTHSFRHSISQILLDQNAETAIVSKLLRHGSIATTLSAYHRNADISTKFESVLMLTGEMPMPKMTTDGKPIPIVKHTLLVLSFKKAA